ncbi:hypothetical protein M0R45_030445 [Rubus argutus]|uniref:Insulin-degrading enzyme-like 1, peroxisomal n=1 Tax=Rubus argutus TaxID=59490 RepID=A0AAW1WBI7_RUBAR
MHLVIYGREKLDKIQGLVEDKFKEIRNIDRSCPRFTGEPFTSEHLQILVRTVPIEEGHKLRLVWPIDPEFHYYKEGPCRYLVHLIGHQAEGSLYYILKTLGWATSLFACESQYSLDFSCFEVHINLTDAGHGHMQDIVGLLFKYISLLQKSGVCRWIFDELSDVCETKFHYQDKIQPIDDVVDISSNMQKYPPKDWLVRSSLLSIFSPDIIQMMLNKLSPNKVRIFWLSKKFESLTNMVEPWYGTAYSIERITDSMIQEWIAASPNENLHLPAPNVFIPTYQHLKSCFPKKKKKIGLTFVIRSTLNQVKCPVLLRKSPYSTLWYKPDTMFFTPKAYIKIHFKCPHARASPEAKVLTYIFTELLMDYLNDYAYYARVAELNYEINSTISGFQVTLCGYSHKLRILMDTVVEKIASFKVKANRFSVIKEMVTKEYQNFKFEQPSEQAMYYCRLILQEHSLPWMEKLEALPHLEAEDLAKFVPMMLSRAFLECYTAGNLESNEAESMILRIEDVFFKGSNPICHPLFPSQHLTKRVVKLEKGKHYIYPVEGLNPSDENSSLVHYIQVHRDDFMLNVKLELFTLIAKQPAFHQLSSVEQLGYITVLLQRNYCGIHGVQFIIQSTVKGPGHIDLRVEEFLKTFQNKLDEMPDDEFKSNVNTLIDKKLEKHKNLEEEADFYWTEIADRYFSCKKIIIAALRQLTQQEYIDFFNEHIKVGAPQKRTLSVRVYGHPHSSEYASDTRSPVQPCSVKIDDIFSFRRSQPLYGSFK